MKSLSYICSAAYKSAHYVGFTRTARSAGGIEVEDTTHDESTQGLPYDVHTRSDMSKEGEQGGWNKNGGLTTWINSVWSEHKQDVTSRENTTAEDQLNYKDTTLGTATPFLMDSNEMMLSNASSKSNLELYPNISNGSDLTLGGMLSNFSNNSNFSQLLIGDMNSTSATNVISTTPISTLSNSVSNSSALLKLNGTSVLFDLMDLTRNGTAADNSTLSFIVSNATDTAVALTSKKIFDGSGQENYEPEDDTINITAFAREFFDDFEFISESYLMTSIAALGIIFNVIAIVAMSKEKQLFPMSRFLYYLYIASEQFFLVLMIAFLQLRSYNATHEIFKLGKNDPQRLDLANFITSFLGMAQTFSTWMLYLSATDAYRSVRQLTSPEKIFKIRRQPVSVLVAFAVIVAYFSAYLPPVRVEISSLMENMSMTEHFDPCNVPLESQWDFTLNEAGTKTDLSYILYYCLGYILLTYIVPFTMICSRNKDIIDVLHKVQEKKEFLSSATHVLYPALAMSVVCNVYLVCVALKMVILTFMIFEYAHNFVGDAKVFFVYLNVYSNFIQVLKSTLHFGVIMIYNKRVRRRFMAYVNKLLNVREPMPTPVNV